MEQKWLHDYGKNETIVNMFLQQIVELGTSFDSARIIKWETIFHFNELIFLTNVTI